MDLDQWIWNNRCGSLDLDPLINASELMNLEKWIWMNGSGSLNLEQGIWIDLINGSGSMVLEQWIWVNGSGLTKSARLAITWSKGNYQTGARVQNVKKKTNLEYLAVQLTVASLIALLALSKDVRQASFPRDDVPQNGAHRFWGLEKRKRNMLKKFHLPITNRA